MYKVRPINRCKMRGLKVGKMQEREVIEGELVSPEEMLEEDGDQVCEKKLMMKLREVETIEHIYKKDEDGKVVEGFIYVYKDKETRQCP